MGSKLDMLEKRIEQKSNRSFLPFFKFPEGSSDLRIVPGADGEEDGWFLPTGMHYSVAEHPVYCPYEHNMAEDDCAICDMVAELRREGMSDEAGKYSVRNRVIVRSIVRGEEEKGVQIVNLPISVFKEILQIHKDTDTWGDILSLSEGRDIRVTRTGKSLKTKYHVQGLPSTSRVLPTPALAKELIEGLTPIETLVKCPTSDEVADIVLTKMGYSRFGASTPEPAGDEYEAPHPAEETDIEPDPVGTDVPFGGDTDPDDEWMSLDAKTPRSVSELVREDNDSLAADLSKKHTVRKD